VAARIRQSAIRDQLVAALDDWAAARIFGTRAPDQGAWLLRVGRAADPNPWRDRFRDPKVWRDLAALEGLADELLQDEAKMRAQSPQLLAVFGTALGLQQGDTLALLKEARRRFPGDFWLNFQLGNTIGDAGKWHQAVGYFRAALAVRPDATAVLTNLGIALGETKEPDEAIRELRTALDLDPRYTPARHSLGKVLATNGRLDEAIEELKKALDLAPKDAKVHYDLGLALQGSGRLDEAIREYRTAIDLDPNYALGHNNLGNALRAKGRSDEAIREFKKAIALDASCVQAHYNLGGALRDLRQLDEAIREFKKAIALDPKLVQAHNNLGGTLHDKGQLEEAVREFKEAISLDPNHVRAHYNLGVTLLEQGRFVEAREATRRFLALLPDGSPLKKPGDEQLRQCEQFITLDAKLPAILEGKAKPADEAERLALAQLCQAPKKRYAAAARFYAEAFAAKPDLTQSPATAYRYNAACAAALAGCGRGEDAAGLGENERARLRRQALSWLKADLALWARLAGSADPKARQAVQQQMRHWRTDADLAGLRDKDALGGLPEGERAACQKLWAEVEALVKKSGG
jgi:tetratricopeptide (TPR) repeat protein